MSLWLSAWSGVRALGQLLAARADSHSRCESCSGALSCCLTLVFGPALPDRCEVTWAPPPSLDSGPPLFQPVWKGLL